MEIYLEHVKRLAMAKSGYNAGLENASEVAKEVRESAYRAGLDLFRLESDAHKQANPGRELEWEYAAPAIMEIYLTNMPEETLYKYAVLGAMLKSLQEG